MKLSEGIMLGGIATKQIFGQFENATGTCALGGAMKVSGLNPQRCDWNEIEEAFPLPLDYIVCPADECARRGDVFENIMHLNDEHRWTRERIADWVATIEAPEVDAPAEVSTEAPRVAEHANA